MFWGEKGVRLVFKFINDVMVYLFCIIFIKYDYKIIFVNVFYKVFICVVCFDNNFSK